MQLYWATLELGQPCDDGIPIAMQAQGFSSEEVQSFLRSKDLDELIQALEQKRIELRNYETRFDQFS